MVIAIRSLPLIVLFLQGNPCVKKNHSDMIGCKYCVGSCRMDEHDRIKCYRIWVFSSHNFSSVMIKLPNQ